MASFVKTMLPAESALMEIAISHQRFIPVATMTRRPHKVSFEASHGDDGAADSPRALQQFVQNKLKILPRGTAKELAKALHLQPTDISKIVSGRRKVQGHEVMPIREFFQRLEGAYGASSARQNQNGLVPVIGYVGAGDRQRIYDVDAGFIEEVEAPGQMADDTIALEIRGNSLGPAFNGGYVFYSEQPHGDIAQVVGDLCVVRTSDGATYVKTVEPGATPETFTLISIQGEPIENVALEWAVPVLAVTPRRRRFSVRAS
jgi:phage repressor protein C with HTH and peptisase S24 domain